MKFPDLVDCLLSNVREDPLVLWIGSLIFSVIMNVFGFWDIREMNLFTNGVLLLVSFIIGIRFFRDRQLIRLSISAFLIIYAIVMLQRSLD